MIWFTVLVGIISLLAVVNMFWNFVKPSTLSMVFGIIWIPNTIFFLYNKNWVGVAVGVVMTLINVTLGFWQLQTERKEERLKSVMDRIEAIKQEIKTAREVRTDVQ